MTGRCLFPFLGPRALPGIAETKAAREEEKGAITGRAPRPR